MWRLLVSVNELTEKEGRDFTAAVAGRLRLGGGGCCFLRRRSGGARSWPAAAAVGNPSAGSGRGMVARAAAFPEEGDDASGVWEAVGVCSRRGGRERD